MYVTAVQLVVLQKCLEEATLLLLDPFMYKRGKKKQKQKKNHKPLLYHWVSATVACSAMVFTNSELLK